MTQFLLTLQSAINHSFDTLSLSLEVTAYIYTTDIADTHRSAFTIGYGTD
ncbi:MAG: hypothetical protein HDS91_04160 [Bacteroidales bacterium]|nr:hypothetical protein [Bacteroidales bacterium]